MVVSGNSHGSKAEERNPSHLELLSLRSGTPATPAAANEQGQRRIQPSRRHQQNITNNRYSLSNDHANTADTNINSPPSNDDTSRHPYVSTVPTYSGQVHYPIDHYNDHEVSTTEAETSTQKVKFEDDAAAPPGTAGLVLDESRRKKGAVRGPRARGRARANGQVDVPTAAMVFSSSQTLPWSVSLPGTAAASRAHRRRQYWEEVEQEKWDQAAVAVAEEGGSSTSRFLSRSLELPEISRVTTAHSVSSGSPTLAEGRHSRFLIQQLYKQQQQNQSQLGQQQQQTRGSNMGDFPSSDSADNFGLARRVESGMSVPGSETQINTNKHK